MLSLVTAVNIKEYRPIGENVKLEFYVLSAFMV